MDDHDRERALRFVATSRWHATTRPAPHEYVVRREVDEAGWCHLFDLISREGTPGRFGRSTYRYLRLGDGWKYWNMGFPMAESWIVNRARDIAPPPPRQGELPWAKL